MEKAEEKQEGKKRENPEKTLNKIGKLRVFCFKNWKETQDVHAIWLDYPEYFSLSVSFIYMEEKFIYTYTYTYMYVYVCKYMYACVCV